METPELIENARESWGDVEFDVDNALSHVILSEPIVDDVFDEVIVPAGEKVRCIRIDHYNGEWIFCIWHDGDSYELPWKDHDMNWIYESKVPEKAERAEKLLEEAQGLLDDIWGETGDSKAEEATRRVQKTRREVRRTYL